MNKKNLLKKIVEHLKKQIAARVGAARDTFAEATHEENRPEDQYDTRGLEASYLAAGQSRQIDEMEQAIVDLVTMRMHTFKEGDPVDVGALVEVEAKGEGSAWYFIGPSGGGTEVVCEKRDVLVLTPQSPLGSQLVGRKSGERMRMKIGGVTNEYRVVSVS